MGRATLWEEEPRPSAARTAIITASSGVGPHEGAPDGPHRPAPPVGPRPARPRPPVLPAVRRAASVRVRIGSEEQDQRGDTANVAASRAKAVV